LGAQPVGLEGAQRDVRREGDIHAAAQRMNVEALQVTGITARRGDIFALGGRQIHLYEKCGDLLQNNTEKYVLFRIKML
jgi:hypothetical protein